MKWIKIIAGIVLVFFSAKEYVRMAIQTGDWFSIPILVVALILIFVASLFLGTALKNSFNYKSKDPLISFGLTSILFALFTAFSVVAYLTPSNYQEINGISIPIGHCEKAMEGEISDLTRRKDYCFCLFNKLTKEEEIKQNHRKDLEKGQITKVMENITEEQIHLLQLTDCADYLTK